MATGWAREGAVQEQIDDTVKDGVARAKSKLPQGPSATHCDDCGEPIPEGKGILLTDDEKNALAQGRGVKSLPGAFRHKYGECAKPN